MIACEQALWVGSQARFILGARGKRRAAAGGLGRGVGRACRHENFHFHPGNSVVD